MFRRQNKATGYSFPKKRARVSDSAIPCAAKGSEDQLCLMRVSHFAGLVEDVHVTHPYCIPPPTCPNARALASLSR